MTDILNIIDEAMYKFELAINNLPKVGAEAIGLDRRAGTVYVDLDNELIITDHINIHSLEYYGGFEYVHRDATTTFGDFKLYGVDQDSRIDDAINYYKANNNEGE